MSCDTCFKEEAHYHIVVEQGKVTEVWYVSADGYWDRDLRKDEYFVEYRGNTKESGFVRKVKARSVKKLPAVKTPRPGNPDSDDWLQPKVYKGKSMHEEEAENQPGWQVYKGDPDEEAEDLS
jgi:hypothetical protein